MLFSTRYHFRTSSSARAVLIWMLTCASVYWVLDGIATRTVPVHVEEYRVVGMSDQQALAVAVQAAYQVEPNGWWIRGKRPYLVFEEGRAYNIPPELYAAFDLEIVEDGSHRPVAMLKPNVASILSP